jgi:hypothetical protein
VEISEASEAIISICEAGEATIEGVVVGISKTFTGMPEEGLLGQAVDNIRGMSHHSTLLRNSHTLHNQDLTRTLPNTMPEPQMKRMGKTFSDRPRSCKSRTRNQPRRKMRSKCHHQADHHRLDHKVSKTHQSLVLPSRDLLRPPRLHQSQRSLQS